MKHHYHTKHEHIDCGVTIIEVVISLVVFLSLLFFSLWLSTMIAAQSTLNNSLRMGMRLAITRADSTLGESLSGDLNAYLYQGPSKWQPNFSQLLSVGYTGTGTCPGASCVSDPDSITVFSEDFSPRFWNGCGVGDPGLPAVLFSNVLEANAKQYYRQQTLKVFNDNAHAGCPSDLTLPKLPPVYGLILAYIYETMRMTVGPSLRYPCNPNLADGAGCLGCRFLNPDFYDDATLLFSPFRGYEIPPNSGSGVLGVTFAPRVPYYRFYVQCEYRPFFNILAPVNSTFVQQGSPVLQARFYYLGPKNL